MKDNRDRYVITQDNKIAKIKFRKTINALSEEGREIVARIYGMNDIGRFLTKWYAQTNRVMYSLEFQYLILGDSTEYNGDE